MSGSGRRIGAMRIALGLAMRAKLAEPDPETLGLAILAVGETFPEGDPLRAALNEFAELFPLARRNPGMLRRAGDALFMAVMRASWPNMPQRADIEG